MHANYDKDYRYISTKIAHSFNHSHSKRIGARYYINLHFSVNLIITKLLLVKFNFSNSIKICFYYDLPIKLLFYFSS